MSAYSEFFLGSSRSVVQLQLLEISHPSFSQTYRRVRNHRNGVTVTHEDASIGIYTYLPMKVEELGARDDLDSGLRVSFGDLGETIPQEIDNVLEDDTITTKPVVKYRTYRSDVLTQPLYGPLVLEITRLSFNREGATFEAKAPRLNSNKTGQLYSLDRFPMLRGFL